MLGNGNKRWLTSDESQGGDVLSSEIAKDHINEASTQESPVAIGSANAASEKSSPLQDADKEYTSKHDFPGNPDDAVALLPGHIRGPNCSYSGTQFARQFPMRYQQDNPIPAALRPGDSVLGGIFMLDVVQHMKDLANQGEFFGNTSCTPCSRRNVYAKQMRFYCVQYRLKDPTAAKCAVRLQLRKLKGRPGWVVFKEGEHIHGPLPQSKKSNRFKCLLRSLQDVERDESKQYASRNAYSAWIPGAAPMILPNLPHYHPAPMPMPLSIGPGGVIAPKANVMPPTVLTPQQLVSPKLPTSRQVIPSIAPAPQPCPQISGNAVIGEGPLSFEMDREAFDRIVSVVGDPPPALLELCQINKINFVGIRGGTTQDVHEVLKKLSDAMKCVDITTLRKDFCHPARYISSGLKEKNVTVKGSKNDIVARLIAWAKHYLSPFSSGRIPASVAAPHTTLSAAEDRQIVPSRGAPSSAAASRSTPPETPVARLATSSGPTAQGYPLYLAGDEDEELEPQAKRARTEGDNEDVSEFNSMGGFDVPSVGNSPARDGTVHLKENVMELKKAELAMKKAEHDLTMRAGNTAALAKAMAFEEKALLLEDRVYKMIVDAEKAVREAGDNATPAMLGRVKNLYLKLERVQSMSHAGASSG